MSYKLVLLDVDGTIRSKKQQYVSERTKADVAKLRKMGIKVAIGSGRPPLYVSPNYLDGMEVDYAVCINGSCVIDRLGKPIYEQRLTIGEMDALLSLYDKYNAMVDFVFYEGHYVYARFEDLRDYFAGESGQPDGMYDGFERTRHLKDMPYGSFVCVADDIMANFVRENPTLQAAPYKSGAYDVYLSRCNKGVGAEQILKAEGLTWAEAIAIGDGHNDVEMLECAGLGIAMGNAPDEVKAHADIVAGGVESDGAAAELERIFGL